MTRGSLAGGAGEMEQHEGVLVVSEPPALDGELVVLVRDELHGVRVVRDDVDDEPTEVSVRSTSLVMPSLRATSKLTRR